MRSLTAPQIPKLGGAAQVRARKPHPAKRLEMLVSGIHQIFFFLNDNVFIQSLIYNYRDGLSFATVLFDDLQVAINYYS